MLLWSITGLIEGNWLIPTFAITMVSVVVVTLVAAGLWTRVKWFFTLGYLARTVLALLAWYQAKGTDFEYWTGLNDDSSRFFLNSYLDVDDAVLTTADPGFPWVNSIVTGFARRLSVDHYLINVQIPLVCGILFAVAAYLWGRELAEEKSARLGAWLIAMHPTVVGWSSGLMRDTVVSCAGWLMVLAICRLGKAPRRSSVGMTIMFIVTFCVAWYIRNMTAIYFACIGGMLVVFGHASWRTRILKCIAIMAVASFVVIYLFVTTSVLNHFDETWQFGAEARSNKGGYGEVFNEEGISARMASTNSLAVYAVAAPYAFFAPFPVYAIPSGKDGQQGRVVDYFFNLGGLVNLFALTLLLPGLYIWWTERRLDILFLAGPLSYAVCMLGVMVIGQSRWMMALVYPPIFLTIGHAFVRVCARGRRFARALLGYALLASFGIYVLYWVIKMGISVLLGLGAALPVLVLATIALMRIARKSVVSIRPIAVAFPCAGNASGKLTEEGRTSCL